MLKIQLDKDNLINLTIERDLLNDLRISIESFDLSWRNNSKLVKTFLDKLWLALREFDDSENFIQVFLDSNFLVIIGFRIKVVPLGFLLEYCRNYSALQDTTFKYTCGEDLISIDLEQQELFIKINDSYYKDEKRSLKNQIRLLKSISSELREILKDSCLKYIIVEPIHDKHAERIENLALSGNYDRRFLVFVDDLCDLLNFDK